MDPVNITVSGNLIKELSEKIPTDLVAINELIKNAYDAWANEVEIEIHLSQCELIVRDDGQGMNFQAIKEFFHISSSSKQYGKKFVKDDDVRYQQGSKGLGFLAVFRFGNVVRWETIRDEKEYVFSAVKEEVLKLNYITEYSILPDEEEAIGKKNNQNQTKDIWICKTKSMSQLKNLQKI